MRYSILLGIGSALCLGLLNNTLAQTPNESKEPEPAKTGTIGLVKPKPKEAAPSPSPESGPKKTAETTLSAGKLGAEKVAEPARTAIIIVEEIRAETLANHIKTLLGREVYIITDNPEFAESLKK